MPCFKSNLMIKEVRARKKSTQHAINKKQDFTREDEALSPVTISRIENNKQNPTLKTIRALMDAFEMPSKSLFYPCLDNITSEVLSINAELEFCIDWAMEDSQYAERGFSLIKSMKQSGSYDTPINRQYVTSMEVKLLLNGCADFVDLERIIMEGIGLTYAEFDLKKCGEKMLLLNESPLLHSLAEVYLQTGRLTQAVEILEKTLHGLTRTPQDERTKEKIFAPLQLSLANASILQNKYDHALELCDLGMRTTIKRNNGYHAPDFARLKAICLIRLGKTEEARDSLIQAYAGYTLLRKYTSAERLYNEAQDKFGIVFELYGMDTVRKEMPKPEYKFGKTISCDSIKGFFAGLRRESNAKAKDICGGICSQAMLIKIETGESESGTYLLEAIMQRYGRHMDNYFSTFMGHDDFMEKQVRDEIKALAVLRKYDELEKLLGSLASSKNFKKGVNLQFVEMMKSLITAKQLSKDERLADLRRILSITKGTFDIGDTAKTRFTHNELTILNQMASTMCGAGDTKRGLRLFEDIIESMDRYCVDDNEKIRIYAGILGNYANALEKSGRDTESLGYTVSAEEYDLKFKRLYALPRHADNIGCCLLKRDEKEESLSHFALAYYGSKLVNRLSNSNVIMEYATIMLGVKFV